MAQAIAVARELRRTARDASDARFVYTTHPWLLLEYLDGRAGCGRTFSRTPEQIALLEQAICDGDVAWHAMPLNYFVELVDRDLFAYGLSLHARLNARFNRTYGSVCGKQADIPGITQAAVPLLAAHGVRALHVGYNGACVMPQVPPAFHWRHAASNTTLLLLVEDTYGRGLRLAHSRHAIEFHYTLDNRGPPSAQQVVDFWQTVRAKYPGARIVADSLDAFASAVLDEAAPRLPVLDGEIGDSWLYGAAADPFKVAAFREIRRTVAAAAARLPPALHDRMQRRILNVPEHNWGLSVTDYLPSLRSRNGNWTNAQFHAVRGRADYRLLEQAWSEKRTYLWPADAADRAQLLRADPTLPARIEQLHRPPRPDPRRLRPLPLDRTYTCAHFNVSFSARDGAIEQLVLRTPSSSSATSFSSSSLAYAAQMRSLADAAHPIGRVRYQTFSAADFDHFNHGYNPNCGPPCGDFAKQGMEAAGPVHRAWDPTTVRLWTAQPAALSADPCDFCVQIVFGDDAEAHVAYGAPAELWLNVTLAPARPELALHLAWFNKTATRLAEALWFSFVPRVRDPSQWRMDVLGSSVSPLSVVENGTRHLHGAPPGGGRRWAGARAAG